MNGPVRATLPDGRLHLQHGPIDLVVEAWGERSEVERAYAQAWERFQDILETLVAELPTLRSPVREAYPLARGPVAKRMVAAVWPHRKVFVTPMAAVAGSVADEMLEAMLAGRRIAKAYVNDGGDIALHLTAGEVLDLGVVNRVERPELSAIARIEFASPVRGVATSGWRGRSQSLGIADAATVLAPNAAADDAAATLIANAVDIDHPSIRRMPARAVKEDSDLGDLPVTVGVGELPRACIEQALDAGCMAAHALRRAGLIHAAYLALQGQVRIAAPPESARSVRQQTAGRFR
ncbi:MAG: UPF0280 family protein [Betaproteobacteria bacterium]|nr:UPF0280 family protein [Betaproteobacteria bacterium]